MLWLASVFLLMSEPDPDLPQSFSLSVDGCQFSYQCLFILVEAVKLCEMSLIQVSEPEKLTFDRYQRY